MLKALNTIFLSLMMPSIAIASGSEIKTIAETYSAWQSGEKDLHRNLDTLKAVASNSSSPDTEKALTNLEQSVESLEKSFKKFNDLPSLETANLALEKINNLCTSFNLMNKNQPIGIEAIMSSTEIGWLVRYMQERTSNLPKHNHCVVGEA
ncbi:hypothetical protein [Pseudomonas sp. Gutcm_11s]|uniref:hypothetical protein n=1 Tax=Pseudomonas sp. Gutcm_11s TaxID=3026088 RepID=UPI00235F2A8F|nr:hypothetical protein [Pseudomonas sp. Gutcm_11s]MDD0841250.1 hypothetical protein [Pseudomonas sp. Gutcm_11s]